MNRYYRQAWENLHESAGSKTGLKVAAATNISPSGNHSPLRRKETMDIEPQHQYRRRDSSGDLIECNSSPSGAGGTRSSATGGEKKRHHHHHHHHDIRGGKDWSSKTGGPSSSQHNHREHNHRKY